jgi:hypothetical protein
MFTTAGMAILTTGTKFGGAGPVRAGIVVGAVCGVLLSAFGNQPRPELKTMPTITPETRKTPAIIPTLNERRSRDMKITPSYKLWYLSLSPWTVEIQ